MTRREFLKLPLALVARPIEQTLKPTETPIPTATPAEVEYIAAAHDVEELFMTLQAFGEHSNNRDQAIMLLVNTLLQNQGMTTYMLGWYGTLFEQENIDNADK